MTEVERMRECLTKIAHLASEANGCHDVGDEYGNSESATELGVDVPGCTIKALPKRLLNKAADNAIRINPVNAPLAAAPGATPSLGVTDPMSLTLLTAKYWGPTPRQLTVSFMDGAPPDLRRRILSHMNAWNRSACISFVETGGTGQVRITRSQAGYWSYLGTDVLLIPQNRPTMCLQGFSMSTPDSEFYRVVRHETGHTLGFPHEHMRKELISRIDRNKAYQYFLATQGWDRAMVDAQVLTPLDSRSIFGTGADQDSIMCYQLPGSITKNGQPIRGGTDINATDYRFAGRIYPKHEAAPAAPEVYGAPSTNGEWSEAEDVAADVESLV